MNFSEKQSRVYGNLALCYELLHQYQQAIFCHDKVIKHPSIFVMFIFRGWKLSEVQVTEKLKCVLCVTLATVIGQLGS